MSMRNNLAFGGGAFGAPVPHPAALMEEMRMGGGPRLMGGPHPGAVLEERLAGQHHEIQGLLMDNQRLAATHVALMQELEVTQQELQQLAQISGSMRVEKDMKTRELFERSLKMEMDLRGVENMRAELMKLHGDVKEMSAGRQDLASQFQALNQDLVRCASDLQKAPAVKAEIETMRHELQRARAAIEYEKKGCADNYERGQIMETDLMSVTRELEKLRAEVANSEKRARAAAAAAAAAAGTYGGPYGAGPPEEGGIHHPYSSGGSYMGGGGLMQQQQQQLTGMENYPQYGGPGHVPWNTGATAAYDAQRARLG